jgi:magnesium-transporting ATPase (P-type)
MSILLCMAALGTTNPGVYERIIEKHDSFPRPGEDGYDYGISHTMAYVMTYLYMYIAYPIIYSICKVSCPELTLDLVCANKSSQSLPIPERPSPSTQKAMQSVISYLRIFNRYMSAGAIGILLVCYSTYVLYNLAYPVGRSARLFGCQANFSRILLMACIAFTMAYGCASYMVLESQKIARVHNWEYWCWLVPVQINIGTAIATRFQKKFEARRARCEQAKQLTKSVEEGTVDEKEALIA